MGDALWWTAAQARAVTADPAWSEALLDVPALVIDLRDDDGTGELPPLGHASCPVIALVLADAPGGAPVDTQRSWPVDLALAAGSPDVALLGGSVESAVSMLLDRVAADPTAAATLARLLRLSPDLDVVDALEVESVAYSMLLAGGEFRRWLAGRPAPRPRAEEDADVI